MFLHLEEPRQLSFNLNQASSEVERECLFAIQQNRRQAVTGETELSDEEGCETAIATRMWSPERRPRQIR